MRRRGPRPRMPHGLGANLDVMTLSGYHGPGFGIWKEVYGENGFPKSKAKRKKRKNVKWMPVGKGCDCRVVPVPKGSKKKGTTKKKAQEACRKKCNSSTRKKRRRK